MKTAATLILVLTLLVPVARGQDAKPQVAEPQETKPPPNLTPQGLPPPDPGVIPAPPGEPPPQNVSEPPPPAPPRPLPVRKKRAWVAPTVIALEAGAVAFAVASVTVISVAGKDDTWRYPLAGGLGGGVIVCAGAGIIIELVVR